MYKGRTQFRSTRSRFIVYGIAPFVLLGISYLSHQYDQPWWVTWGFIGMFLLSVAAIFEVVTDSVSLDRDTLRMRHHFRNTVLKRDDIESVSREKGSPTWLLLKDGRKVEVPDMGVNSIDNSIRSWLRAN